MTKKGIREMGKTIKYRDKCPYCGKIKNKDRVCRICGCVGQIEELGLYIMQIK